MDGDDVYVLSRAAADGFRKTSKMTCNESRGPKETKEAKLSLCQPRSEFPRDTVRGALRLETGKTYERGHVIMWRRCFSAATTLFSRPKH